MGDEERDLHSSPSPNFIVVSNDMSMSPSGINVNIMHTTTAIPTPVTFQRAKEFHLDSANRPVFSHIGSDYHLLENLMRYAKICEKLNVNVTQMATSLARAIGIQNKGEYNVLIYDYLLAIPDYPLPPSIKWCNVVCYKNKLFGVAVFPALERLIFYFPEFTTYNQKVQSLIFSYGNKILRYCPEKNALAFDFIPPQSFGTLQPIMLTATLKRRISEDQGDHGNSQPPISIVRIDHDASSEPIQPPQPEYIQLE